MKALIRYFKTIDRRWLIMWLAIYVGFLFLDAFSHLCYGDVNIIQTIAVGRTEISIPYLIHGTFIGTTVLKYLGIVLNLVYARQKFHSDYLLQIALALTLLADTILCIDSTSVLGVFVFCFAQYFHSVRLSGTGPRALLYWSIGLVIALFFGHAVNIPMMFVVGPIYALFLCANLVMSFNWYRSTRQKKSTDLALSASACALYGFFLFACCDSCVTVSYFGVIGLLPAGVTAIAGYFAWVFYYVSQILVANSSVLSYQSLPKSSKNLRPLHQ